MTEEPCIDLSPKGSPATYDMVTESDGNGSIVYTYDNGPAYTYQDLNYPAGMYIGNAPPDGHMNYKKLAGEYRPWNYGNLLSKDVRNTMGQTVQTEGYEYEEYTTGTLRDFVIERWIAPECLMDMYPAYHCDYFQCAGPGDSGPSANFDICFASAGFNVFNFADRYHISGGVRIKVKSSTVSGLINTTQYFYENPQWPNVPTKLVGSNSKGEDITTYLKYPFDFTGAPYDEMVDRNIIAPVVEQSSYKDAGGTPAFLQSAKTNYNFWNNTWGTNSSSSIIVPQDIESKVMNNNTETRIQFNKYDTHGNILEQQKTNGVKETYLYGYKSQYPVAKIIGSDYPTVSGLVTQSTLDNAVGGSDDAAIRSALAPLRNIPNALATTYTYKPFAGITSQTDPAGRTTYYEYDAMNRLYLVRDQDNNILKRYCYGYTGQVEACPTSVPTLTPPIILSNEQCVDRFDPHNPLAAMSKCVNNHLQTQTKRYTSSVPIPSTGNYICTYHYEFSDRVRSDDFTEISANASCTGTPLPCDTSGCSLSTGHACNYGTCYPVTKVYKTSTYGYSDGTWHWTCTYRYEFQNPLTNFFSYLPIYTETSSTSCLGTHPACDSAACSAATGHKCINGNCETGTKVYTSNVYLPPICTDHTASQTGAFTDHGTVIFDTGFNADGTGALVAGMWTGGVWRNRGWQYVDGPFNRTSVWRCDSMHATNSSVSFSRQVNFPAAGTYYVGMSCANGNFGFGLDSTTIVNTTAQGPYLSYFSYWNVYPIKVTQAGLHTLTMFGLNSSAFNDIGCEVYNNTLSQLQNASQMSDLNILYSTANETGGQGSWLCTYHYLWADGSVSANYTVTSQTACQ